MRSTAGFPTKRRPQDRQLSTAGQEEVNEWFEKQGINISPITDTPEKVAVARRLCYT